MMKKLVLMAVAAVACGSISVAHAAATIGFDPLGTAGANAIAGGVDNFSWGAGNALIVGAFSDTLIGPNGVPERLVVAQGKLAAFISPGLISHGIPLGEFTYQVSFFEEAVGLATSATILTPDPTKPSSFKIFYDTNAGTQANDVTGLGFGDGLEILTATLVGGSGNFVDNTQFAKDIGFPSVFPVQKLDQLGVDNQHNVGTRIGNGSTTVQLDASYADPNFFLSSITSLVIDLQDNTFNSVPFSQTNPSDSILGFTPYYTKSAAGVSGVVSALDSTVHLYHAVNGEQTNGLCPEGGVNENGSASTRCDLHLETHATTSFNPTVPEPGSLALIGLALGGLGLVRRRAKR